jgi:hypothetical protein
MQPDYYIFRISYCETSSWGYFGFSWFAEYALTRFYTVARSRGLANFSINLDGCNDSR